ncbi:MAG TPA: flagellar hook-associated protein FlgK [Myxococcales bacterium]|nr:flagellar hook-associated protein FlgK [Myxococcales bacterium]
MSTWAGISTALSSLRTQRVAIDVAGQNIANVNTPGYVRQRVDMTAGIGVDVSAIQRLHNGILGDRTRSENAQLQDLSTASTVMGEIEEVFPEPTPYGLQAKLDALWGGFSDVARDPGNSAARVQVLAQADGVTDWLNNAATELGDLKTNKTAALTDLVTNENAYSKELSELNVAVSQSVANTQAANALLDRRGYVADQLAAAVGGSFLTNDASQLSVTLGGGTIVGPSTYATLPVGNSGGTTSLQWVSDSSSATVSSGSANGYLTALNTTIDSWTTTLNAVASAITTQVNAVQTTGFDRDGNAGNNLFTGTTAATISVALTDGDDIAASAVAPAGGNASLDGSKADAMAAIAIAANGPDDLYQDLVVSLGFAVQAAEQSAATQGSLASSLMSQIDAESGVSIDEEMANLLAYQRAYEAAARVLTAIDAALETLINRTGVVGR